MFWLRGKDLNSQELVESNLFHRKCFIGVILLEVVVNGVASS